MIKWLLEQVEKDPTTLFRRRDLLGKSPGEFERLRRTGLLVYVQTDPEDETYPCDLPCAKTCPRQIVQVQGQFHAMCPEDGEIDPIRLGEDDLHKYAFSMERLLEEIRKSNHLSGCVSFIEPGYSYMGYTMCDNHRIGFALGPAAGNDDELELSGLRRLCKDDDVLVVFSRVSVKDELCFKKELRLHGMIHTSLAASLDFTTFAFDIRALISRLSGKEQEHLLVNRERSEVTYHEKTYPVTSRQIDILEALCKHPGAWVSGSEIKHQYDERLDKVKRKLPAPIRKLIESHTVKGYRLKLP